MAVRALRGATTLDEDTTEQMQVRVKALLAAMFERNGLGPDDVISAFFTATPDLRCAFPATAARPRPRRRPAARRPGARRRRRPRALRPRDAAHRDRPPARRAAARVP